MGRMKDATIKKIQGEVSDVDIALAMSRAEYDRCDANDPHGQAREMEVIVELLRKREKLVSELEMWERKR